MSLLTFRPGRWALGLSLLWASACGRNDFTLATSGGTDDGASSSSDSGIDSTDDTSPTTTTVDTTDGVPECGNGVRDPGEACDGTDLAGQTCVSVGFEGGTLGCQPNCLFDPSGCFGGACGNGVIDPEEQCDGDDLGGFSCEDFGFSGGFLGCSGDCLFDLDECFGFECGNDNIDPGEVCDGNDLGGIDCVDLGFDGGVLQCQFDCDGFITEGCFGEVGNCCVASGGLGCDDPTCEAEICAADPFCCSTEWDQICADAATMVCDVCGPGFCGNDIIEGGEVCDGLDLAGADCTDLGFAGGNLGCTFDCGSFDTSGCFGGGMCGNDFIEPGEVCDGFDLGGQTCISQGFGGGMLGCAGDCGSFDTSGCNGGGAGDCCMDNGSPGCDDPACEADVCAADPFCCSQLWDQICADAAGMNCQVCQPNVCGNNVIEGVEICDGNDLGGESCVSQGFAGGMLACAGDCNGFDTAACIPPMTCGDGMIGAGEVCDGANLGGQTCVSQGFGGGMLACAGDCGSFDTAACIPPMMCGDGVIDAGEVCDGANLGGETCVSQGFAGGVLACAGNCGSFDTSACLPPMVCGDGMIGFGEVCDGANLGGETCVSQGFGGGMLACAGDCGSFDTTACIPPPVCGDDMIDAGEVCDGADLAGETCVSQGFAGGNLGCAGDCSGFDTTACIPPMTCGNGSIDAGETCDGADLGGETCVSQGFAGGMLACAGNCGSFDTTACIPPMMCGNGSIDAGEACDGADLGGETCVSQGFAGGMLACAGDCTFDTAACVPPMMCGNGSIDAGEACDGADLGGETCVSQGFGGGMLACAGDCTFDTAACVPPMVCGNGSIDAGEACDGADLGGQTCISQGFGGGNLACAGDCTFDTTACTPLPVCGDDMIDAGEVCDGTDLAGLDCTTLGFAGGNLGCLGNCSSFDTSGCTMAGDDCCAPNGTPGCNDADCESTVCAVNPFCCFIDWDAICANIATGANGGGDECLVCTCGNGALDGNETCDGADLGGETCVSQGFGGGNLGCIGDCSDFDTTGCAGGPMCGDNLAQGMEVCDGADLGGETCVSLGFVGGNLGCQGDCSGFDTSACVGVVCGDGMAEGTEECDGADLGGQTCTSLGFDAGMLGCQGDCTFDTGACTAFMGDCCAANGSPGCSDPTCTADICTLDPSCCSMAWDGICADAASGSDGGGNECLICGLGCAHSPCDTGMELSGCQGSNTCVADICSVDPFCCNNSWDGICVSEVGSVCGLSCP